ncbi:hypothetical protein Bca4012_056941 [Brassica carinata]
MRAIDSDGSQSNGVEFLCFIVAFSGCSLKVGEDPTCWMGVKIPAWRSMVAREVRLQSPSAKDGSFRNNEGVYGLFLTGIRVCFTFESLDLLVLAPGLSLKSMEPLLPMVFAVSIF